MLERIVAHERAQKSTNIDIYLFDPNEPGMGCHQAEQPEYLLVNTVAGQITQFSDWSVKEAGPVLEGASFYHWLQDQQHINKSHSKQNSSPISSNAYYSRSLFGRYLQHVYHYILRLVPSHLNIHFVKSSVKNADRNEKGEWFLTTDDHSEFCIDYLFLTSGHTKSKAESVHSQKTSKTTIINDPYPIRQTLGIVKKGMTVAIEGMGLTSFDVLSELTVGRGGRFQTSQTTGEMQYIPSGNEPQIIAFSRSGLPLTARAANQKGVSLQYRPRFLLLEHIRSLRSVRKLDFVVDILPLLLSDMEYAYYEAYLKERHGTTEAMLFCNQFVCSDANQRTSLYTSQKHI